ncbi:hypothetical protein [Streptomyces sp. uw30]|uniref:hypothetical protein n=1 Tax=Streptomyces sp. uw30 TaxID=1828179 RepID=UPI0016513EDE|nr:hypothetical protein [Streptomyces sp. uw30]
MRTAFTAAALGTLFVLGGAAAAHADVDDQSSVGAGSQGAPAWQGPSFDEPAGAGFGSEGTQDDMQEGQQGFGDADTSFLQ